MVYFKTNGEKFAIHEALIKAYEPYAPKSTKLVLFNLGEKGDQRYRVCNEVPVAVFRGLVSWLYYQELPLDDVIKQSAYPGEWARGAEKTPLACRMAVKLCMLAHDYNIWELYDDAITFLFLQYKEQRMSPSADLINMVFGSDDNNTGHKELNQLLVHLHYKFGASTTALTRCLNPGSPAKEYVRGFLMKNLQAPLRVSLRIHRLQKYVR
jgi:hypothetical protein